MKIAIRIPNWIGDAVMFTPALEALIEFFPNAKITLVGTYPALSLFERDERINALINDDSKKAFFRIPALYALAKKIEKQDIFITTQNTFLSALLGFFTASAKRIGFASEMRSFLLTDAPPKEKTLHQALRYHKLVEIAANTTLPKKNPFIVAKAKTSNEKIAGINPGAAFGSAKRWREEKFAKVAKALASEYKIVIFGGSSEQGICDKIGALLKDEGVDAKNLCGKTNISELIDAIAQTSLFVTNDSGPMHIASALGIPLVAIFGPTDHTETHPFGDTPYKIVRHDIECAPCKKRACPLKHHKCMEEIAPSEVLEAISRLEKRL